MRPIIFALILAFAVSAWAAEWPKALTWRPGLVPGSVVGMDAAGRVVQLTLSDGRTTRQDYLPNGRRNRQSTSTGRLLQIEYDVHNRVKSVSEDGVTRWDVYDDGGDLMGVVQASNYGDVVRLLKTLGLQANGADQKQPLSTRGNDGQLSSATNDLARARFEYGSGFVRQWLDTARWSFWVQRNLSRGTTAFTDSAGGSYSYVSDAATTRLLDAAGKVLVTWTYDSQRRLRRVDVVGTIVIDYVYDSTFEWTEKIIRQWNGQIVKRFSRRDYDDPADASAVRARFRGPTGETLSEIDGDSVTYFAGVLAPYAHLTADGSVIDRVFSADSSVPYCNDEIRITSDGSIRILPALPHAEYTFATRSVQPFEITLPFVVSQSVRALKTMNATSGKSASSPGKRLVPLPEMAIQIGYCDWISGGTVDSGSGPVVTPGRWDCGSYWTYSPDPVPPPPVDSGGAIDEANGMPLTPAEAVLLNQAKSTAGDRLSTIPNCEKMFDDLQNNGARVIDAVTYRDGTGSRKCTDRPTAAAVTDVGGYTTFLCSNLFNNLSSQGAATIVIHEALHSAGMSENPPDPSAKTSAQISAMVQANCSLSW